LLDNGTFFSRERQIKSEAGGDYETELVNIEKSTGKFTERSETKQGYIVHLNLWQGVCRLQGG
jgi:hypothetical protein